MIRADYPIAMHYRNPLDVTVDLTVLDEHMGWPDYDWRIVLWTTGTTKVEVSSMGGELKNCSRGVNGGNSVIHILVPEHNLMPGMVVGDFYAYLDSENYPEGKRLNTEPISFNLELTRGASTAITKADVKAAINVYEANLWNDLKEHGYTGTEAEFVGILDALPGIPETEKARAEAEQKRVNAERERVINEQARATAERERQAEENARRFFEQARMQNEKQRQSAEQARAQAELSRENAEATRKANENNRQQNEDERQQNERAREINETARGQQEAARNKAEQARAAAESARAANEQARLEAEGTRQQAEEEREQAESARETNETARAQAESARSAAEVTREANEQERETKTSAAIGELRDLKEEVSNNLSAIDVKIDEIKDDVTDYKNQAKQEITDYKTQASADIKASADKVDQLVADADATIATNTAKANEAIQTQIDLASKGKPNGIASLDADGKVVAEQLPDNIGGVSNSVNYAINIDAECNIVGDKSINDAVESNKWSVNSQVPYNNEGYINLSGNASTKPSMSTVGVNWGYRPKFRMVVRFKPQALTYGQELVGCSYLGTAIKGWAIRYNTANGNLTFGYKMFGNVHENNSSVAINLNLSTAAITDKMLIEWGEEKYDDTQDVTYLRVNNGTTAYGTPHPPVKYSDFAISGQAGRAELKIGESGTGISACVASMYLYEFKVIQGEEVAR